MPSEVRLEGSFGKERRRLQRVVDHRLRPRDVVPVWHRNIFGTVEIDEAEARFDIDPPQTFGNLALDSRILIDAYEQRPVIDIEQPGTASGSMRRRLRIVQAPAASGQQIGRPGRKVRIGDQLVTQVQQPAALFAAQALRVAFDDKYRIGGSGWLGKHQFADGVHPRIGMSVIDVGIIHPHLRIVEMQPGNHARGTDPVGDVTQVLHAVGILLAPAVVAARAGKIDVIDHHRAESAPAGVFDMGIDIFGCYIAQRIVRTAVVRIAAALDTPRQIVVLLDLPDGGQQPLTRGDDKRRTRAEEANPGIQPGIERRRTLPGIGVDARSGMSTQQIDGRMIVPDDVEPLAEMFARAHGELQQGEFVDLGLALHAVGLDAVIDPLERKADIVVPDIEPNDGDVVGILELHIEPVAAPLDPVGRENARLGRVDQKVLVVIRSVLCNRADRSSHTCSEALLARGLQYQTAGRAVRTDHEPHAGILDDDILPAGLRQQRSEQCAQYKKQLFHGFCSRWVGSLPGINRGNPSWAAAA